jgi:N-acylneuraminate cytidylyltransferase
VKNFQAIAIIPARGGSKRIPQKNIRPFLGKPVITYSINAAIESGLFDEIMVSTDSEEIAGIARNYGANVPFFRSDETSSDFAGVAEVITEVLDNYHSLGTSFEYFCCIFPTAPLTRIENLLKSFNLMVEKNYESVFSVTRFSYPILRSLKMIDGKVEMNWPEYFNSRSQDLPPAYHDAGQFYWMRTNAFREQKRIFARNSGGFELNELESQDIDNETDWALAELKYKLLNHINE